MLLVMSILTLEIAGATMVVEMAEMVKTAAVVGIVKLGMEKMVAGESQKVAAAEKAEMVMRKPTAEMADMVVSEELMVELAAEEAIQDER
jgi:hypothetical protein